MCREHNESLDNSWQKSPRPTETHVEGELYKHATANFHREHETKQHEAFKDVSESPISSTDWWMLRI